MRKLHQTKSYLVDNIVNNLSDKNVLIIICITIFFIFALIFSVKSPERRVIDSPIMWKSDYLQSYNSHNLISNIDI